LGSNEALALFLTKAPFSFSRGLPTKAGRGRRSVANPNAKINAYQAASAAIFRGNVGAELARTLGAEMAFFHVVDSSLGYPNVPRLPFSKRAAEHGHWWRRARIIDVQRTPLCRCSQLQRRPVRRPSHPAQPFVPEQARQYRMKEAKMAKGRKSLVKRSTKKGKGGTSAKTKSKAKTISRMAKKFKRPERRAVIPSRL